jgi:hypothetical protein
MTGGMAKLVIAGSIQKDSVQIDGPVKLVSIGNDMVGDSGSSGAPLATISESGIEAYIAIGNPFPSGLMTAKSIGTLKIGGSIKGGAVACTEGLGSMSLFGSLVGGGLYSGGSIRSVKVRGTMWAEDAAPPATMTARDSFDVLVINGDVKNARILAGYNKDGEPVNPDAHIGKVIVRGDWIQSSLVAGVEDSTADGFGQNDTVIDGDTTPSVVSRIASVVIRGTATGSAGAGDHFGIVAQQIDRLSIGGTNIPLGEGIADDILLDDANGDFRLVEVAS